MKINRNIKVAELKKSFTEIYPFLSLRVYSKLHDHFEGSPISEEVADNISLCHINEDIVDGSIAISDDLTVDSLETQFRTQFGLSVQIFRKSGNQWLQTTSSDDWTLVQQNDKAADYNKFLSNAQ